jgi:lipopolysaccharide export system protein LptA
MTNYSSPFLAKFLCLALVLLQPVAALAEKADSQQPLVMRSESQTYDGNTKVTVYTGNVHMIKGTLIIDADRLEVVEDANGGKIGTLFSNPGKLVKYRQKRDGGPDLWAEGEADKVVYDDTLELIKLFNKAKLVLLNGKERTHESSGIYISYDSRTDFMQVHNTLDGVSVPGAGFTNAVIYPDKDKDKDKSKSGAKTDNKSDAKSDTKTKSTKAVTDDSASDQPTVPAKKQEDN